MVGAIENVEFANIVVLYRAKMLDKLVRQTSFSFFDIQLTTFIERDATCLMTPRSISLMDYDKTSK